MTNWWIWHCYSKLISGVRKEQQQLQTGILFFIEQKLHLHMKRGDAEVKQQLK